MGMKTPGGMATGRGVQIWTGSLDDAEHNGSDEGERDISGDNAQSADESHGNILPWFTSCPHITHQASKAFPAEKVSVAVAPGTSTGRAAPGNVVNNS
ncbi:hypothetical protein SAMN05444171_1906 [Bradyrhizobium lablabi]|jgi:hypothetical protein|uniref:Uncharacterized protein n=2 Tax=Bradyrhizobium TaxID=374 RepID=A0ABY0Q287_9BRAD|nr:hypothetical protein SAMN05444163_5256 [Bradyrhizobium ottawaense]SEC63409.1 hypothetical protein SAMN05444171_1906 [Bradyrhizobium lablabi]SHK79789.1 hypothetical protein SAMN05444321_0731 [Bradyrhizobium lablabi]